MSEQPDELIDRLSRQQRPGEHPETRDLRLMVTDGWLDDEILDHWKKRKGLGLRGERDLMARVAAMRRQAGEQFVRGISRRQLEHAYQTVAAEKPGMRPARKAVATVLHRSEPTLERACKEGLDCHPWPGSLPE